MKKAKNGVNGVLFVSPFWRVLVGFCKLKTVWLMSGKVPVEKWTHPLWILKRGYTWHWSKQTRMRSQRVLNTAQTNQQNLDELILTNYVYIYISPNKAIFPIYSYIFLLNLTNIYHIRQPYFQMTYSFWGSSYGFCRIILQRDLTDICQQYPTVQPLGWYGSIWS